MGRDDGSWRSGTGTLNGSWRSGTGTLNLDPRQSVLVCGSQRSSSAAPELNVLARSMRAELHFQTRSGAGFSKVLSSLDASKQPRACSHRLNFVRPAKIVGSGAKRSVPSMRDAWWATKAANAAASKREFLNSMMSIKAATKFSKLLQNQGKEAEEGGDGGGGGGAGRMGAIGGGGSYAAEPIIKITEEEVEAHREYVRKIWDKLKPAQEAAALATTALEERADELWEGAYEELVAARVGERPEDKEYYDLTKIRHPTRTMTAAASCVILALDRLVESMPITAFGDHSLGEEYEKRRKRKESARRGRGVVVEADDGEAWRDLCAHRLFGDPKTMDHMMNQLWAHTAGLAWDGGGALLTEAESKKENDPSAAAANIAATAVAVDAADGDEMKPESLPAQCVRAATKAAQDLSFGISGDSGRGDDVENGVLKFLIIWTKQLAFIDRKMQVANRQHGSAVQSYVKLVAKHNRASSALVQLDAAYAAMKKAEEALLEEVLEEEAKTIKLHP